MQSAEDMRAALVHPSLTSLPDDSYGLLSNTLRVLLDKLVAIGVGGKDRAVTESPQELLQQLHGCGRLEAILHCR